MAKGLSSSQYILEDDDRFGGVKVKPDKPRATRRSKRPLTGAKPGPEFTVQLKYNDSLLIPESNAQYDIGQQAEKTRDHLIDSFEQLQKAVSTPEPGLHVIRDGKRVKLGSVENIDIESTGVARQFYDSEESYKKAVRGIANDKLSMRLLDIKSPYLINDISCNREMCDYDLFLFDGHSAVQNPEPNLRIRFSGYMTRVEFNSCGVRSDSIFIQFIVTETPVVTYI